MNAYTFLEVLRNQAIAVPKISVTEIEEKSKGNAFVKAIAAIQVLYLSTELLGRAIQHLAVTTLELFTLAMVIMALFLYALWWNKPLDVRLSIILEPRDDSEEVRAAMSRAYEGRQARVDLSDSKSVVHTDNQGWITVLAVINFGVFHLIGWNFEFPTNAECLLWRIASVCCVILPLSITLIIGLLPDRNADWFGGSLLSLYIIIRLYLIDEVFIGLRRVPASAYQRVQ